MLAPRAIVPAAHGSPPNQWIGKTGGYMDTGTLIFFGVVTLVIVWAIAIYNQLVALANRYKNGFAQIEVQLKRRYDLIPNLVETAKGYLSHER